MANNQLEKQLEDLSKQMEGDLRVDYLTKVLYATDASAYREMPLAVAIPKSHADLALLVDFASKNGTSLIPRGAGTSLAGQVVGRGIVVDLSKNFNHILELNAEERWVRVEPGVILAELNLYLKSFGLQFGPETSTANRCTLGGMLGNNSCGLHSLVYGSVRDHILEVDAFLSDGSEVTFGSLTKDQFEQKRKAKNFEGYLYDHLYQLLSDDSIKNEIVNAYPDISLPRRNHGYALDTLLDMFPFKEDGEPFNMSKLLAGSEGTLALTTSMKLSLDPVMPSNRALVCIHFEKLEQTFLANLIGLKYRPAAIELMDKKILDLTKSVIGLRPNRFFIEGDPGALMIVELWGTSETEILATATEMEKEMRQSGLGCHFPLVWGSDIPKVWELRKAGLGVLSNIPGDAKPVSVIEDTAVPVNNLPFYIADFQKMLDEYGLSAVFHGHIATGELHLRPVLNLKESNDVKLFRIVATRTAELVKKYRGSLSGEHGDGRLRGEFIPFMFGQRVYDILKQLKKWWDPNDIFNPGKIIDTPKMDENFRLKVDAETPDIKTYYNYDRSLGYMRAIERCNGSGDCLKSELVQGTMCPSYKATHNEMHSTRGRANLLREIMTYPRRLNWTDDRDLKQVLDLCLSCKACKSECPSGVDMTKIKADFLQTHYEGNRIPFSSWVVANYPKLIRMASLFPNLSNGALSIKPISLLIKKIMNFDSHRNLPHFNKETLEHWSRNRNARKSGRKVYLFNDEFLNTTDSSIGMKAILLLERMGYEVIIPKHTFSGRTWMSKGLLDKAQKVAIKNVELLADIVSGEMPLIGIEPSAILSFRDEYIELVPDVLKFKAAKLAKNVFLIEEFIAKEFEKGNISSSWFTTQSKVIKLHGHCHQKSIAPSTATKKMLEIPENYKVMTIPSGCCGMAGAYGYEKTHYEISMKIGELILFPEIRKATEDEIIAAPGTSCREQIMQGTGRKALHPIEVLFDAWAM